MNRVKRWLAGFLSFAMIFTSSAFANVGMVYAQKVDPENANKVVKLTIGETTTYWDAFNNALIKEINSEKDFDKTVTVDLLKTATVAINPETEAQHDMEIERPLTINFNGYTLSGEVKANDSYDICAGVLMSGDAQTGIKFAKHNPVIRYVWGYNDKYGKNNDPYGFLWAVTGAEGVCANCYGTDGADSTELYPGPYYSRVDEDDDGYIYNTCYYYTSKDTQTAATYVGYEEFNYTLGQYEFWVDGDLAAVQKTTGYTVVDGPKFETDGTVIRHDANGNPVVKVKVLKNLDGSVLADPEIELTKATYIEEEYNIGSAKKYDGTDPEKAETPHRKYKRSDLTAPTCSDTGKSLYKVIVKDPEGIELAHDFIVDEQAPTAKHEAGELAKVQILTRVGVGLDEDSAIADALSIKVDGEQLYELKDIVEVTHARYNNEYGLNAREEIQRDAHYGEPVKSGGKVLYFAWAWVDVEGSASSIANLPLSADWAGAMDHVNAFADEPWSIAITDDGTFKYRPVYYCKYKCDETREVPRLINGKPSDPVAPQANETVSAKNTDNVDPTQDTFHKKNKYYQYSTCTKWNYGVFSLTKDVYEKGKLKSTSTNTYYPASGAETYNTFGIEKPESAYSHDLDHATTKAIVRPGTCKEDGYGTFTCPVCGVEEIEWAVAPEGDDAKHIYGHYPVAGKPAQEEINDEFVDIHNISDVSDDFESTVTVYPTCEEEGGVYKWCARSKFVVDDFVTSNGVTYVKIPYTITSEEASRNNATTSNAYRIQVLVDEALQKENIETRYGGRYPKTGIYNPGDVIDVYPFIARTNNWAGVRVTLLKEVTATEKAAMLESNKGAYEEFYAYFGHWELQGDPIPATKHKLSTEVVVSDECWGGWTTDGRWIDASQYDVAAAGADYIFTASQSCLNSTDAKHSVTVYYHSIAGTDTDTDKYSAVEIKKADSGSNCITNAKTTWTVKGLTVAGTNGAPVTKTVEKPGSAGPHKIKVNKFIWSSNLESAEVNGTCEVCTRTKNAFATVTKKTAENGITTFTATYGDYTDTKTGYSLNGAKVLFDADKIKDGNRVRPEDGTSQEVPNVTVTFENSDGTTTVLNPDLYEVFWDYDHQTKTAIAFVDWTENIQKQPGYIYTGYAYGTAQVDANMQIEPGWKYNLNGVKKTFNGRGINNWYGEVLESEYDPTKTYELVPDVIPNDATIKYAVVDEPLVDGSDKQERIEALKYDQDKIVIHNAGKFFVYAQISKDGYTTYTYDAAAFIITRPEIVVQIDDLTVTVGEDPLPKLSKRAYEFNSKTGQAGKAIEVNWDDDFKITTVGGDQLASLDAGDYKLNVQAPNYSITTVNDTYIGTLYVIPKDQTVVDAEKIAEELATATTDDALAAAYAKYAALSDELKKVVESNAAAKANLEKAKAAYDAKQAADKAAKELADAKTAANSAIASANAYASDATIKALIDALNAALAKGDTAAIKKATADLNNAVAAKKAAPAKKKTPTAKIKTKSKKFKAKDLKKKAKTFKIKYSKTKGSGKATFKKMKGTSKKLKVSKSGKVTVKKGTKKGSYKLKVQMTVAAKGNYSKKVVKKTIKVVVK